MLRSIYLILFVLFLLPACSSSDGKKLKISGERISVLDNQHGSYTVPTESDVSIDLQEPAENPNWQQSGGATTHDIGHSVLNQNPKEVWSTDIGSGASGSYKLLSQPVIAEDKIFAMDSKGVVTAYRLSDGKELWERETEPKDADNSAIGGGISYDKSVIYASTGFGEVLALEAKSGKVIWRRSLKSPLRSAPTISDNRLFVISIDNETFALDAKTSLILWQHRGISESSTLMGSSSPAVDGDTVVVAYSSGELFGIRAQNGRVVWDEVLAMPRNIGALPAIADIKALPVIHDNRVYAISHGGRMVSLQERRGDLVWDLDIGGINTPVISGNVAYIVSLDSELIAIDIENGQIIWKEVLQSLEDMSDKSSKPVMWFGPVLANNKLWLTNSMGSLISYDAITGKEDYKKEEFESSFSLPPIIAKQILYVLSDDGDIIAFK